MSARLVALVVIGLLALSGAQAGAVDLSAITDAITEADTEVRTSIFPAVAGIFGGVLLLSLAVWLVKTLQRGS